MLSPTGFPSESGAWRCAHCRLVPRACRLLAEEHHRLVQQRAAQQLLTANFGAQAPTYRTFFRNMANLPFAGDLWVTG